MMRDKWPSGAAGGGKVSRVNPAEFTARALTMECGKAGEVAGTGEAKYRGRKDSYRGLGFVNVWRESKRGRKFHVWQERR